MRPAQGQQSWLQTTVSTPGTIRFYWSVSAWQYLRFYIDGQLQTEIWGPQSWTEQSYYLSSGGPHTVKWTFSQQSQEYSAWGCVDRVEWSGPLPQDPPATDWRELVYVYDAAGRRVEKKYNNVTVLKYIYDGDHCIAEYDGSNNLRRKYIYGPSVDEPIAMIEAAGSYAGTYYYHFDGLGSVVALTNASGNTVEVYEYETYGRVGASDASHPNRILFTGREYDKETGLYYYRARYYNPQIGRFLQTDPIGYKYGMNRYTYCGNGPLDYTDPTGMLRWEDPNSHKVVHTFPVFNFPESWTIMNLEATGPGLGLVLPTYTTVPLSVQNKGGAYTASNFIWQAIHGKGEALHFYTLQDPSCKAFAESEQISKAISAFKDSVMAQIKADVAMMDESGQSAMTFRMQLPFSYDFASKVGLIQQALSGGFAFYVLGHGTLNMDAQVKVLHDGSYSVTYAFSVADSFHDVFSNEDGKIPHSPYPGWWCDPDNFTPFDIYIDWTEVATAGTPGSFP